MQIASRISMWTPSSKYSPVEWIDTGPITSATLDAGAVIDTGIKIDDECEIACEILPYTGSGNAAAWGAYFGSSDSRNPNDTNCVVLGRVGNDAKKIYWLFLSNGAAASPSIITNNYLGVKMTIDAVIIDNIDYGPSGTSSRFTQSNYSLMLGCRNSAGNHWRCSRARYKSFSIERNGIYLCNMMPVVRNSDGVFGMYDAVSKSFATSLNSHPILGPT